MHSRQVRAKTKIYLSLVYLLSFVIECWDKVWYIKFIILYLNFILREQMPSFCVAWCQKLLKQMRKNTHI